MELNYASFPLLLYFNQVGWCVSNVQKLLKYISKWFISLQRHNIKFDWFRYHLLCILLLFHLLNPQMCFIFYLSIWQRINQLNLIRLWWYQLAILTNEMPHPTLQHQPTRHRGTVIIWAKHITKFTSTQQTLMLKHFMRFWLWICLDLFELTCQMYLNQHATWDSPQLLKMNICSRPAPGILTTKFLIQDKDSWEPNIMLQFCDWELESHLLWYCLLSRIVIN